MLKLNIENQILWFFIAIKFVLAYVLVNSAYELQRDEFLHIDLGRHLAWGYTSVPPFTGLISYLIITLGSSVFWVKFFPALFGALTTWVVWMLVRHLKGGLFAMFLALTAVTLSVVMRINILYQPNSFDILSWTLVYFSLIKYLDARNRWWIWSTGLLFAIGFLNKYNIVFLLAGLIPGLLLTKSRLIFLKKDLYLAAALALILISPNLLWQYQNHFPVVHHMKELAETQLINVDRLEFVKEQLLFFIGALFVLIAALCSFISYPPFRQFRFLFFSFFITVVIFIYFRAKGYYAIGLYPVLLAFGSIYIEHLTKERWKLYLRPVAMLVPVLLFIPVVKRSFPIYPPAELELEALRSGKMHSWEDGKQHALEQDFADMLGWKELAHKVEIAYATVPDKRHTLILCDNYGQAGAINFYCRIKGLNVGSFNADYLYWMNLNQSISTIISVKVQTVPSELLVNEKKLFRDIIPFGSIENKYAREYGTAIFVLSSPRYPVNTTLENYRQGLLKADSF
jgi:hypothetical protein